MGVTMSQMVATGREAIEQHDWDRALEAFLTADAESSLAPDDLLLMADALWWKGEGEEAERAFERAYGAFLGEGRRTDAALVAARLAYLAFRRLAMSVGSGWVARAEHLVETEPESAAHAWLAMHRLVAVLLLGEGDFAQAIPLADEAIEIAGRTACPEIQSMATSFKGLAMVYMGNWREGMALVDEAAVMAISEQSDLRCTSDVYCNTIAACSELADYRRAHEWTERAEAWMKEQAIGGYPGICQVHRAELKLLSGSWPEAEEEALKACRELERFKLLNGIGFAQYEIGEARRRMGDLAGAEEAFLRAYEYGHPAQPGLALLMLNRGEVEQASSAIAAALEQTGGGVGSRPFNPSLARAGLLPAQVEIALAAGDLDTAAAAIEELEEVARVFEGSAWQARALTCRGSVELTRGKFDAAIEALSRAWRLWQEVGLPYENAQARTMLGRARLAKGDTMGAGLEFGAARSVFSRLGAKRDLRYLDELSGGAGLATEPERARETKTFMFTDIVTSTDLIGLIGDSAWENLLKWHDRILRDSFRRHRGEEVRHTGDGFFVAFDDPKAAIECAVDIQRRLAEHRKEHGFAPWVRIGVHEAEATRQGDDFSGGGVHVAARIGDLGEREQIVVSASTMAGADVSYPLSEPEPVSLKGVSGPIQVHTVDWR